MKPKPIWAVFCTVAAVVYPLVTIAYFVSERWAGGFIWLTCSLLWIFYTAPSAWEIHRSRVALWERRRRYTP